MTSVDCWLPIPEGSDFTIRNLPFGVADHAEWSTSHVVVAIGDQAIDCTRLARAGLLQTAGVPADVFDGGCLNPFMALGRHAARAVRHDLIALLTTSDARRRDRVLQVAVVDQAQLTMRMPAQVGDYVDFYSSEHHAANLGRILRPGSEPLPPNWKHLPMSYHGRSGTICVSGTDVRRPRGLVDGEGGPTYRSTVQLDIELEMGVFVGAPSSIGQTVPAAAAGEHLFGMVLFNDWSARDIQAFEYQPLGPHLAKSFLSSVSPWIVTFDALETARVPSPMQDPPVAQHLRCDEDWGFDITLTVALQTARMRDHGVEGQVISRTNFSTMYWTVAQQLAHVTSSGASLRAGDLFASGTVSGPARDSCGSMIELTWRGRDPLCLPTGETRSFLEDGDEVTLRGWTGEGPSRVGFGSVTGRVVPSGS